METPRSFNSNTRSVKSSKLEAKKPQKLEMQTVQKLDSRNFTQTQDPDPWVTRGSHQSFSQRDDMNGRASSFHSNHTAFDRQGSFIQYESEPARQRPGRGPPFNKQGVLQVTFVSGEHLPAGCFIRARVGEAMQQTQQVGGHLRWNEKLQFDTGRSQGGAPPPGLLDVEVIHAHTTRGTLSVPLEELCTGTKVTKEVTLDLPLGASAPSGASAPGAGHPAINFVCLFVEGNQTVAGAAPTFAAPLAAPLANPIGEAVCLVLEAVNLPEVRAGRSGEGSAFVEILLRAGSERDKTPDGTQKKGTRQVEGGRGESVVVHSWNHTSRFWVRDPNDILVFSVYVKGHGADGFVGHVEVPISMIAAKPEQTLEIGGKLVMAGASKEARPTVTLNLAFFPLRGTVFSGAGQKPIIPTFDLPHPDAHLTQPEKAAPHVYKSTAMRLGQYDYQAPLSQQHARADMPTDADRRQWASDPFFGWNHDRPATQNVASGSGSTPYTRNSRVSVGGGNDRERTTPLSPSSSLREAAPLSRGGPRYTSMRGRPNAGSTDWSADPFSQFRPESRIDVGRQTDQRQYTDGHGQVVSHDGQGGWQSGSGPSVKRGVDSSTKSSRTSSPKGTTGMTRQVSNVTNVSDRFSEAGHYGRGQDQRHAQMPSFAEVDPVRYNAMQYAVGRSNQPMNGRSSIVNTPEINDWQADPFHGWKRTDTFQGRGGTSPGSGGGHHSGGRLSTINENPFSNNGGHGIQSLPSFSAQKFVHPEDRFAAQQQSQFRRSPDGKPRLLVKCVRAHNLRNADWMGESDPYVKVTLGKEKKETKVIYNCLNPVWNEELMLPFRAPQDFDQRVRIDVIDWDPPPKYHDPLGHLDIPLQELRHHQELRVNENLIDGDKGRIELVISLLQ